MAKSSPPKPADDQPISPEERDRLLEPLAGRPLALCVSGGPDSMALMYLVAEWAQTKAVKEQWMVAWQKPKARSSHLDFGPVDWRGLRPPKWLANVKTKHDLDALGGPPQIIVLTVDHQLRPESSTEAKFVESSAKQLGLNHQTLIWQDAKPKTALQETARAARHSLLLNLLRAEAGALRAIWREVGDFRRSLVLGHHLDDQAETLLMRLSRGSGIDGLTAMKTISGVVSDPCDERPSSFSAELLRPILSLPKSRLVATLRARGSSWIEDSSNDDERFERARLRKVMSALQPLGFSAEKVALSARRLADAEMAMRRLVEEGNAINQPLQWTMGLYADLTFSSGLNSDYAATRIIRNAIESFGGSARAPELAQVEELYQRWKAQSRSRDAGGCTLGGCRILFQPIGERWGLRIFREGCGADLQRIGIDPSCAIEWDARFALKAHGGLPEGAEIEAMGTDRWTQLKREIPGLEKLRLPAAAMATLPVLSVADEVIGYPALNSFINSAARQEVLPKALVQEWKELMAVLGNHSINCTFLGRASW